MKQKIREGRGCANISKSVLSDGETRNGWFHRASGSGTARTRLSSIARQRLRDMISRWRKSDRCIWRKDGRTSATTTSSCVTGRCAKGDLKTLSGRIVRVITTDQWVWLMWVALIGWAFILLTREPVLSAMP